MFGISPYVLAGLCAIICAPTGYLLSVRTLRIVIGSIWLVAVPVLIAMVHADGIPLGCTALLATLLLVGCQRYRAVNDRSIARWLARVRHVEDHKTILADELATADRFERGVRAKELAIVNLYEITKKMSKGLKFEEIFSAVSIFLEENFHFRRCELVVLPVKHTHSHAQRIYSVWQGESHFHAEEKGPVKRLDYEALTQLLNTHPREYYATRDNDPHGVFAAAAVADPDTTAIFVVPLLSEKKMVAFLLAENLPRVENETFTIVAMQCALEIKKVLLYETVEALAITDGLTGLYVRRYFLLRAQEEIQRSKRYAFSCGFLMVDIDNFKLCNDTYGHLVGDIVLKTVGRLIRESVREIDLVARYGGEEFFVVLPETDRAGMARAAERIRSKIADYTVRAYDEKVTVTVSIGMAFYPDDGTEVEELVERADEALYAAKHAGKNSIRSYANVV